MYGMIKTPSIPDDIHGTVRVVDGEKGEYATRYRITHKGYSFHVYAPHDRYQIGDRLLIKATIETYPKQTIPKGFDAYHYYLSKGIHGRITSYEVIHHEEGFSLWSLREVIKKMIDQRSSSPYVKAMLLGERLAEDEKDVYHTLGLSFLMSVSGIHLYAWASLMRKCFYYMNTPMKVQRIAVLLFYGSMTYLHRLDIGIMRLFLMTIAIAINDHLDLRRSNLELYHVVMVLLVLMYGASLMFSSLLILYLIVLAFYMLEPMYRGCHPLMKRWIMGIIVMIILLPFHGKIVVLGILLLPFLGLSVASFLMISSILVVVFKALHVVYIPITDHIYHMLSWMSDRSMTVSVGTLDSGLIVLYFLLIILFFISRKYRVRMMIIVFVIMLFIIPAWIHTQTTSITFLDVGQGDATIITSKGCVMVIDAYDHVYDYLTHHGISTIHYLILTHSDHDHIQEASILLERLRIEKLLLSSADHHYPIFPDRPTRVKAGDRLRCGDVDIHVLSPAFDHTSSNEASIVMRVMMHQTTFLLMGDAEQETENYLIKTYGQKLKSDVLKVGHHGSNTSSSSVFLHYVKPTRAIISLGRLNRYGFPHDDVIHRLLNHDIVILRTDLHGTIRFLPTKKKHNWQYSLPF